MGFLSRIWAYFGSIGERVCYAVEPERERTEPKDSRGHEKIEGESCLSAYQRGLQIGHSLFDSHRDIPPADLMDIKREGWK
jgi:hypothetical protein